VLSNFKGKFLVTLKTEKSKNGRDIYLLPEYLEALPNSSQRKPIEGRAALSLSLSYRLSTKESLMYEVDKSTVDNLVML